MDRKLYTLIVHSENFAGLLNQVTAVFTRQQLNIESLNVSASSIQGVHKYTVTVFTDYETIEKVAKQIEKKIDVISAHYFTDDQVFSYEVALYKLSTPEFQTDPEVSLIIGHYNASVVNVNTVFSILVKSGTSDDITALYKELQQHKVVLQFVRSGRVAVTTSCYERVNEFLDNREAQYQSCHQ
jgi:acetolactate synthase small subunit